MLQTPSRTPYICARCLSKQSRRLNSTSTKVNSQPSPPPSSGAAKLTTRRLISLHGTETPKFLQGIITNNVSPTSTTTTGGFYAAFLTAQGKILHDTFVYPTLGSKWNADLSGEGGGEEPGFVVEVDAEEVETLMRHLKRHKLRSKFKLRVVEEGELDVWAVWREGERWTIHGKGGQQQMNGGNAKGDVISLTDSRAPGMGQRLILPGKNVEEVLQDVEQAPLETYTLRRYLKGVPEGQKEMPREDSLPMNCNMDLMGGIDFKKGCYVGQELTIRTHHTGVVRRRILPVMLYPQGEEVPQKLEFQSASNIDGAKLSGLDIRKDDKRKRSTGKMIAGIGNIGLGMCRLEQMTDLKVSSEPSPFSTEDKFLVQDAEGGEIGVGAFVPDWIRGRIREPKIQKRVE